MTKSRSSLQKNKKIKVNKIIFYLMISIVIIGIPLWGLSKFYQKPSKTKVETKTTSTTDSISKLTSSFKDDLFKTTDSEFRFKESTYIRSNTPVIVVNYQYTNNSKDVQTAESIIWNNFDVKQEVNGILEPMGYYTMNVDEPYYDDVKKSKDEVQPGESILAAYGFTLNNESSPLIIDFIDENKNVVGTKEIMYSKELAKNNPGQEIIDDFFTDTENNATTSSQTISDMPPSWYGTAEEWEIAKQQGWTAEDYEAQVKASENESGPLQPGDPNYEEISTDETTLSGFINKYGMSPAMYKIQNEGMSEEDALRSTPDSMKTSGEIQLGHSKYGI